MSFTTKPATEANACAICFEDYKVGEPITSHEGDGALHPMHRHCLDQWSKQRFAMDLESTCGTCNINVTSVDGMDVPAYKLHLANKRTESVLEITNRLMTAIDNGNLQEIRRILTIAVIDSPILLIEYAMETHRLDVIQTFMQAGIQLSAIERTRLIEEAVKVGDEPIFDYLLIGAEGPFDAAIMDASMKGSFPFVRKLMTFGDISLHTRENAIRNAILAARANRGSDHLLIVRALVRYPDGIHLWGRAQFLADNPLESYAIYNIFIDHAYKLADEGIMKELLITGTVTEDERNATAIKRSLALFKPIVAARLIKNEVCHIASAAISDFADSLE